MYTRRAVLKSSVALGPAGLAAGIAPFATTWAQNGTLPLERLVFDARFAEAFDIAQHVNGFGIPLSPTADDLMDLWYSELDLRWREQPMALAGVTMVEALFVLETLALDRQMRVVYRGQHSVVENGRMSHRLAGPASLVERFAAFPADGDWKHELAAAITECPLGMPEPAEVAFETRSAGLSVRDVPLVSWIIAPRSEIALTIPS